MKRRCITVAHWPSPFLSLHGVVCEENQDHELKFSHYDFRASEAQVSFKGLTTLTNE